MVRACSVLNCTSTGTTPSHAFPKNQQMRDKWIANLMLKPHKQDEICKLRVCYKHFKESDYTGSCTLRRLTRAAVPFMDTSTGICQKPPSTVWHEEQNIQQQTITVLQENVEQLQMDVRISEKQENVTQLQKDVNILLQQEAVVQVQMNVGKLSQQQEEQQENVTQLQRDIEKLSQVQAQMQTQHQDQLQEMVKELSALKTQLQQNAQARRPNLGRVTRKKNLSPIARKFYENNIKAQAQERRMRRVINRMKQ